MHYQAVSGLLSPLVVPGIHPVDPVGECHFVGPLADPIAIRLPHLVDPAAVVLWWVAPEDPLAHQLVPNPTFLPRDSLLGLHCQVFCWRFPSHSGFLLLRFHTLLRQNHQHLRCYSEVLNLAVISVLLRCHYLSHKFHPAGVFSPCLCSDLRQVSLWRCWKRKWNSSLFLPPHWISPLRPWRHHRHLSEVSRVD